MLARLTQPNRLGKIGFAEPLRWVFERCFAAFRKTVEGVFINVILQQAVPVIDFVESSVSERNGAKRNELKNLFTA